MAATITLTFNTSSLAGRKLDLTRPGKYVIGRSSDCDIRLPAGLEFGEVSRHHCVLEIDPAALRVRDLGSRNGTFVNGQTVGQRGCGEEPDVTDDAPWHPLREGDELRLGGTVLRVGVARGAGREKVREAPGPGVGW